MALLGVVSVPTAARDIGLESEQYSLGATVGWSLGEQQSLALYANVDLLEGQSTWTVSPSWGIALADSVGAFIEAGYQFGSAQDQTDNAVAGGGLTWMVTPVTLSPALRTASCTRFPYIPRPPNFGRRAGWIFRMRPRYAASVCGPICFM